MHDPRNAELQKEVQRLIDNKTALFELLPDFLFIISSDYTIERMNEAAVDRFGNARGGKCYSLFNRTSPCDPQLCPLHHGENQLRYGKLIEREVHAKFFVEYTYVPFEGYRGHELVLVIMRDITSRKMFEKELIKYQSNIEKVLQQKIEVIKEKEKVREQLALEVNVLKKELDRLGNPDKMVGESMALRRLREMIYQVAGSDVTILITGESGTGKELVADMVYQHSARADKPYLKFNCAAINESLLESDLFGYEKGAFTGATAPRKGKFEVVDGGTIFLDEIGDISPRMQAALLRVLQNGEIIRVGGVKPIQVDVRVITATNRDLAERVEKGLFRQDLYYRLNVVNLHQPPLRERKEDILPLVTHFLRKYRKVFKKRVDFLPEKVLDLLLLYDWPGNIRELENVVQRAVLHCRDNMITPDDLHLGGCGPPKKPATATGGSSMAPSPELLDKPLKESLAWFEEQLLRLALENTGGRALDVAQKLQVGKTALYTKLKRYRIDPREFKQR